MEAKSGVVVYMTEPEVRYVSLVKRGANRTPFRIAKQQEERGMKIIQRIVAKKGTDVAAIKSAVGEEAAGALNFSSPVNAGAYDLYVQHPAEAFKSDDFSVVALTDDNTVLGVCGELVEKSDGFVSKLLSGKSRTKGVEIPEDVAPVDADVLKADLSGALWSELDALCSGLRGVLGQEAGENVEKVLMAERLCDNFMKTLKTTAEVLKSEDFGAAPAQKLETVQANLKKEPAEKRDASPAPSGEGSEAKESAEDAEKALVSKVADAVLETLQAREAEARKAQDDLQKAVSELTEAVSKMQKAPAGVVGSLEDSGVPPAAGQVLKSDNVFAGCFGDIRR